MIGFMYKKTLIESLDRFFLYLGGNFITMGLMFCTVMGYVFLGGNKFIPIAGFVILYSVYISIWLGAFWGTTDRTRSAFSLLLRGVLYGLVNVVIGTVCITGLRFYALKGGFGYFAAVICAILLIFWSAASVYTPYYLALQRKGFIASFKKSFDIFNARPGIGILVFFSYMLFIVLNITFFVGSSFGIGIVSQIGRAYLLLDEYADAHPHEEFDWKQVFAKEIENIEDVNLKGILMPWKKNKIKKK
jgi:hypothetical protein